MRKIKFRAWDKKKKKMCFVWAVGYYKNGTIADIKIQQGNKWKNIKNFILLQYTGLKDESDREIYEGDIVKGELVDMLGYNAGEVKGVVCYVSKWGCYAIGNDMVLLKDLRNIKVVGNIHENPELLKEG